MSDDKPIKIQNSGYSGAHVPSSVDTEYRRVANDILDNGISKGDRTGTGTLSTFGQHMEFDISNGKIPMLTTKKVHLRVIIHELLWMLSGDTNIRYLKENNVHIWDSWCYPDTAEYYYYTDEEILSKLKDHFVTPVIHFDEEPSTRERYTRNEDGSVTIRKTPQCDMATVYRALFTEEPRRLVAADLPRVYGKQWRRWEDTRIVPLIDWYPKLLGLWESEVSSGLFEGSLEEYGVMRGFDTTHALKAQRYRDLGYEFVGDIDVTTNCVIHRVIDQIANIVDQLKNDPDSRRIILNAWNVGELDQMALQPCHTLFQLWTRELTLDERLDIFYRRNPAINGGIFDHDDLDYSEIPRRELSSLLYMRSNDLPLGNPFNIVQYALLTHMLAQIANMTTGKLKYVGGDVHVYNDQIEILKDQLENEPMEDKAWIMLNPERKNIDDFVYEDFKLFDYESHGVVRYPAAAV